MNETDKIVLKKFRSLLLERVGVDKIMLFGSRARADAEPDSDVDVLVILDEPRTPVRSVKQCLIAPGRPGLTPGPWWRLLSSPAKSGKRVRSSLPCWRWQYKEKG